MGLVGIANSGVVRAAGLTLYAINILGTFILEPSHAKKQSVIVGVAVKSS